MRANELLIEFVSIMQQKYPDAIFQYEYMEEDDLYQIWHTYTDVYTDDKFKEAVGDLIMELFVPEGLLNVYIVLNANNMEGNKMKEWHKFSHNNPDTYPAKTGCYLCLTIWGIHYELCWDAILQMWRMPGSGSDFYNPLAISHYMKLPPPPLNRLAGIELEETK